MICANCGRANREGARFCDGCGASLSAGTGEAAAARKVVTIVFADLIGSTALHERLDAESAHHLMEGYYRALHAAVAAHGGTVVKLLGDGVMAAFGVPRVSEDDAIRAVRAALAMQEAFRELVRDRTDSLGLRVAVNTGEVVVGDDHSDVVGDPVNVAARLQQEAQDGDVLIGESTRRLVGELVTLAAVGERTLKGRAETVAAYRVLSLDRPTGAPATAFVGRDDELRRLRAVYRVAVRERRVHLAVVVGSPGLGKSRLLAEFGRRIGDAATLLTARCDPTGGTTFAPLAEALRAGLRLPAGASGDTLRAAIDALVRGSDAERARIADGIGALLAGRPATPEETFFVVRRLLAAFAATQPVLLAVDDLQWAEPLLLDLIEHLVQWGTGMPLFVLTAARPELRDTRAPLTARGGLVAEVVTLAGLDAGAATRLAANVIGADALPAAVAGRVLATSEGNPLFVGELVRMLVQDGALKRDGDRWTAGTELASLEMPPTIHALLAARVERLGPGERAVLERAAVVGRQFSRAAVAHLLPHESAAGLDARLDSLRRSELIEPDTGAFLGQPALRFHHALIRDAAYRRLLKGTRAELHAQVADWIEQRVGETAEHDETIGWHLEQAHQHLRELGPLDAQGRAFGERAARHLAAAGRRALARDDLPVAASLLGRAIERLDPAEAARGDLALDWCEALLSGGEVSAAGRAIGELGRFAAVSDRLRAWHTCFVGQLAVLTDPQALRATAEAVAAAAEQLAAVDDAAGAAKAHSIYAAALARLGKIGASEAALDRALAAARQAGDRRRANAVLAGAPEAALWGPSAVTRASGRCLDVVRVLRITQGAPAVEAVALRCQAVLEALRGRTDAARRMIASARHLVEELGITQRLLEADVFAGMIELLEGDAVAAERCLRSAFDGLREHGLGIDAAQAAALLGRALLAQGRVAEAEALSYDSETLAGDDLKAAIAWRGVRAEAFAGRGEHGAAVELARAAVDIAAATDALLDHADARLALAVALRASGRKSEADAEEARAIELWETKGATLLTERARRDGGLVAERDRTPEGHARPPRPVQGRVEPNAATAHAARLDAAIATGDAGALVALISEPTEVVHHPTGAVYDRRGVLGAWRALLRARDVTFVNEPLATLGDSLALCRTSVSFGALADDDIGPFGAVSKDEFVLSEVDAGGQRRRAEFFAADRLGDAVARLYQRHAELLPDGPVRIRAIATAGSVTAVLGPFDLDRYAAGIAPDVEFADHRIVGFPSGRGRAELLRSIGTLLETADDVATRVDDVLALRSNAFLVRWTTSGTDRISRGPFEWPFIRLCLFGADGLLTRAEQFDLERDDDALARLDELTAEPPAERVAHAPSAAAGRRVRANAATANGARVDAAIAARDAKALADLFGGGAQVVEHPIGVAYERQGVLFSFRSLLNVRDPTSRHEPLATLGDSLALCHWSAAGRGAAGGKLDVGAHENELVALFEVDAQGRRGSTELFAPERLADAIARLYERYADVLSDAPARRRAAATAHAAAALLAPPDLDRYAAAFAPEVEFADHRTVGLLPSTRGADALVQLFRTLFEIADNVVIGVDEVLALEPDSLLVRWRTSGIDRTGGGTYERRFLVLWTFGADGRLTRLEEFDAERTTQALARHAELSASAAAPTPRIENAATRAGERIRAAVAAGDWERFAALFPAGFRNIDRQRIALLELDRDQYLEALRPLFETFSSSTLAAESLATRGDRLALGRLRWTGTGPAVGPVEIEWLAVLEVDQRGDPLVEVGFDSDALDAAYAELEARYAAGEAAASRRTELTRAFSTAFAARDWETLATLLTPDLIVNDHRVLGWETLRGPAAYVNALRSLVDLAPDVRLRIDHISMADPAFLYGTTFVGTRDGGSFEAPSLIVAELDEAGCIRRFDQYDIDQLGEARERFEAVGARAPSDRLGHATS